MVSREVSAHRVLASDKRVAILHALQESPEPLGIDCLAAAVGLHVNTTREHIDRLVASGYVSRESEQRTTRGRPRILYRASDAAPRVSSDLRARDQLLRLLLNGYGRRGTCPGDEAEEAGLAWGHTVAARDQVTADDAASGPADEGMGEIPDECMVEARQLAELVAHFGELGFDPVPDLDSLEVHLRRCPYRDIVRERPEVVCNVHLGLARGVLEESGGPLWAERLEPRTESLDCVLHLARTAEAVLTH